MRFAARLLWVSVLIMDAAIVIGYTKNYGMVVSSLLFGIPTIYAFYYSPSLKYRTQSFSLLLGWFMLSLVEFYISLNGTANKSIESQPFVLVAFVGIGIFVLLVVAISIQRVWPKKLREFFIDLLTFKR